MIRRTEYRLQVAWPDLAPHVGVDVVYNERHAQRLVQRYREQGATVTVEIWKHAGQDLQSGWYRDAKLTAARAGMFV